VIGLIYAACDITSIYIWMTKLRDNFGEAIDFPVNVYICVLITVNQLINCIAS